MAANRARLEARFQRYEERHRKLAEKLAETGYLHDGTVGRQSLTCGKAHCACATDSERRHGPYAYWTSKVRGRTVSRRLGVEEADLLEEWVKNRRELDRIRAEMIELSKKVAPILLELQAQERDT